MQPVMPPFAEKGRKGWVKQVISLARMVGDGEGQKIGEACGERKQRVIALIDLLGNHISEDKIVGHCKKDR